MSLDIGSLVATPRQPLWGYYISVALMIVPTLRILARMGFKPWPALFLFVPYVGYVFGAAYLALNRWPRLKAGEVKP